MYSSVIYSLVTYKKIKVENRRHFNKQILNYRFELVVKLIINKYYKDLFIYLLFFLPFYFCL